MLAHFFNSYWNSCWENARMGQLEAIGSTTSNLLLANKKSSALHLQREAGPTSMQSAAPLQSSCWPTRNHWQHL